MTINTLRLVGLFLLWAGAMTATAENTGTGSNEDIIPFTEALDNAAIVQDAIPDVYNNSLLIGNGDINGLVNIIDGKVVIRLTKNDIGDWRHKSGPKEAVVPFNTLRKLGAEGAVSEEKVKHTTHNAAYPCPIPYAKITVDLKDTHTGAVLDLKKAAVRIGKGKPGAVTVRSLYQSNVFLIRGGADPGLLPHGVGHLKPVTTKTTNGLQTIFHKLPADVDWPGMSYAVALASRDDLVAVAVVSSFDAEDPLSKAIDLAKETVETHVEKLVAAHEASWDRFWSVSGVQLADKYLEGTWYRNLYFLRTISRPGAAKAGLYAGLVNDSAPKWHGDHHLDYNAQQTYWGAFASGHLELAESYRWIISRYMAHARWLCRHLNNSEGVYFNHALFTYQGDHSKSKQPGRGAFINYPWSYCIGMTGWVMHNIWREYEYGGRDLEFLRKTAYPMVKEAALFYANFIGDCEKQSDGKVLFGPSVSPEHYRLVKDLRHNWNEVVSLVYARFALESAIEGAQRLDIDTELVERFRKATELLPEYPTNGEGDSHVVVKVKGAVESGCNVPCPVFPVYPGEQVTWFSSPEQKSLYSRTISRLVSNGNNDTMILSIARARLSLPDTYDFAIKRFKERQRPNGIIKLNQHKKRKLGSYNNFGHYTEMFAATAVVSEMLMQSVADIIRLFPAWPLKKDASFSDLCAKGGFLVSSELKGGKVQQVTVKSTVGGTLQILTPWPGIAVRRHGETEIKKLTVDEKGIVSLTTKAGEILTFQPAI